MIGYADLWSAQRTSVSANFGVDELVAWLAEIDVDGLALAQMSVEIAQVAEIAIEQGIGDLSAVIGATWCSGFELGMRIAQLQKEES